MPRGEEDKFELINVNCLAAPSALKNMHLVKPFFIRQYGLDKFNELLAIFGHKPTTGVPTLMELILRSLPFNAPAVHALLANSIARDKMQQTVVECMEYERALIPEAYGQLIYSDIWKPFTPSSKEEYLNREIRPTIMSEERMERLRTQLGAKWERKEREREEEIKHLQSFALQDADFRWDNARFVAIESLVHHSEPTEDYLVIKAEHTKLPTFQLNLNIKMSWIRASLLPESVKPGIVYCDGNIPDRGGKSPGESFDGEIRIMYYRKAMLYMILIGHIAGGKIKFSREQLQQWMLSIGNPIGLELCASPLLQV